MQKLLDTSWYQTILDVVETLNLGNNRVLCTKVTHIMSCNDFILAGGGVWI